MDREENDVDQENARLFGGGQSPSRRGKRLKKSKDSMSDEEIIESGSGLESTDRVPKWFTAIIVVVLLIAYGLTMPFWGDRTGSPRDWFSWGQVAAFAYFLVFGGFVYVMTTLYSPNDDEDNDDEHDEKK